MLERVSIVIPVLNEAAGIARALGALQVLRAQGHEIIIADGGSTDSTLVLAAPLADLIVNAPRGRAAQMNAGAAGASGDVLLFLHADTQLPADAAKGIVDGLKRSGMGWGRFDVTIKGSSKWFFLIAGMMNLRSRLTGVCTGDQAIFVRADVFRDVGGFPPLPLMEDIAFCAAMKKHGSLLALRECVTTSGRRWDQQGVLRTIALMWCLRLAYYCGADPDALAKRYGYAPSKR